MSAPALPNTGFWLRPAWLWEDSKIDIPQAYIEIRGLSDEQSGRIDELL